MNPTVEVGGCGYSWIRKTAQRGDHSAFMDSNLRRRYSDADYRKTGGWFRSRAGSLGRRLYIQANVCLMHDASDRLGRISAPTLMVGGGQDRALGAEASPVLAAMIPGARLKMYPEWGHALYEEAKDFNRVVLEFLPGK